MKKTFKLMLVAVIALLGFSSASAAELVNSTQYDTNGFQYVIKSLAKNQQNQWVGTVSMKKNDFSGTSITINPTVNITVEGTVNNVECKGTIAFKIVEIEENAFAGLSSVTSVTFATGCNVEIIGAGAFAETSVSELDLTNTKITTLNKLFETNNVKLNSVVLPSTLTTLAPLALADCIQLSSVDFSACTKLATLGAGSLSNTIVSEYDFSNCRYKENNTWHWLDFQEGVNPFVNDVTTTNKNLTTVTLPLIPAEGNKAAYSPVTGIYTIFANCEKLTTIGNFEISKVVFIKNKAFENCISLTELTFPASLSSGDVAVVGTPFVGCTALATLAFQGNPNIGSGSAVYGTNEDDLAALKTLKFLAPNTVTQANINEGAFKTNTGITTLEFAVGGKFAGRINANSLSLSKTENCTVTFGTIGQAPATNIAELTATLNTISGPEGIYTTELTIGEWTRATLTTAPIVSGIVSSATVGKVNKNNADQNLLKAIGQAKVINFTGDIDKTATIVAPAEPNAALTTINFNAIKIGDGATADIIAAAAFNGTNAPNLTAVSWIPATDPTAKVFNIAAFGAATVGDAALVTLTTSAKVAALYESKEINLYNVIFDAAALDPTPQTISVYGNGSSTYFYGFVKPAAKIFIEKTQGNDQVVVYSAFVDSKDQKIYMDPLALTNGCYIIPANQVVVVRMKNPSETEDMTTVAGGKKAVVNAYAAGETDYPTLRIKQFAANDYHYMNDLELTDKIFSSDYIGTTYIGKTLYAMANPAVVGELEWNKVEQTSYLPKGAVFVQTDEVTAAAARLELVWLDGADNSEVTGIINNINKQENDGVIYNLQGIRVNGANKGLYIQNGKKFIVK